MSQEIIKKHTTFFKAVDMLKITAKIAIEDGKENLFYKCLGELKVILLKSYRLKYTSPLKFDLIFNLRNKIDIDSQVKFEEDQDFKDLVSVFSELRSFCFQKEKDVLVLKINESVLEVINAISIERLEKLHKFITNDEFNTIIRLIQEPLFSHRYNYPNGVLVQGFYEWYFRSVYNYQFVVDKYLEVFDTYLYIGFKKCLKNKSDKVLQFFIERTIDGKPFDSQPLEFNFLKKRGWKTERYDEFYLSKLIAKFNKVYLKSQYVQLKVEINDFIREIQHKVGSNKNENDLKNFEDYLLTGLHKKFIFNNIKVNLIHFISYSLFMRKSEDEESYNKAINIFLEYNQPALNRSTFLNKDVFPVSLDEMFDIVLIYHRIENKFFGFWDGHNDNTPYLDFTLLILFARIYTNENGKFNYSKTDLSENKASKVSFVLEKLVNLDFKKIIDGSLYSGFKDIDLENFKRELTRIVSLIKENQNIKWLEKKVEPDIVQEFKKSIFTGVFEINSLYNFYKNNKAIVEEKADNEIHKKIGINTTSPKGYFIKDDSKVYFNWPGTYSQMIRTQMDNFLLMEIIKISELKRIQKHQIVKEFENLNNKYIISINYRVYYDALIGEKESFEHDMSEFNRTGFIGNYKDDNEVFEISLLNSDSIILVLDKSDFGTIHQGPPDEIKNNNQSEVNEDIVEMYDNVNFQIDEFVGNVKLINEVISSNPQFLRGKDEAKKIETLKDLVLIRFYIKLKFEQPKISPKIYQIS